MLLASRQAGFSDRELVAAGLAQRAKGEGRTYDRFRRRIMFPLCDQRGRVLGFGARAMGADQKPKYLNSSDGLVFHKGRHLFGADIARAPAAKAGAVVVAEGYTDVIALHQAGLRHTVGLMGTAMTDEQVGELARLAPTVLLALDADAAGQEAMLRGARVAARRNLELRVVPLPAGDDPADLVAAEGARAMADRVDASVPFVRFRVERELAAGDLSGAEGKDAVIAALRPVFARRCRPSAMREELVGARRRPHGARAGARRLVAGAGSGTPRRARSERRQRRAAAAPAALTAGARRRGARRAQLPGSVPGVSVRWARRAPGDGSRGGVLDRTDAPRGRAHPRAAGRRERPRARRRRGRSGHPGRRDRGTGRRRSVRRSRPSRRSG